MVCLFSNVHRNVSIYPCDFVLLLICITLLPNYVILVNWTDQGIKNVKESASRAEVFQSAIENAGAKSTGLYYTLGKYDIVAIVEATNDELTASILYHTGSLGNIRTETLRAFSVSEGPNIIEKIF
jgi:uncharacterized protein with GYD domain